MSITGQESAFEAACEATQILGAVLAAADASGKFRYIKAIGKTARGEELSTDSVMLMGGCTNLMTTVAVLQLINRGLISLDQDVRDLFPELAALEDNSEPDPSYIDLISDALISQPGDSWTYRPGLGWAGKLVGRVSNLPLKAYMRTNIWDPLAMRYVSFFPASDDELEKRRVSMSLRDETGRVVASSEKLPYQFFEACPEGDAYGGGGCWCSAESYLLLLQSLGSNTRPSLAQSLVDEMFRPQLDSKGKASLNQEAQNADLFRQTFGQAFDMYTQSLDGGLGGEVGLMNDIVLQKAGTMACQLLPMGDAKVKELAKVFQQAVYQTYGQFRAT
ncbi:transesterase [Seiridium cupressi]